MNTYQLLIGGCTIQEAIVHTAFEGLDIIPSTVDLAGAEAELLTFDNREYILKEQLSSVAEEYDYIINKHKNIIKEEVKSFERKDYEP